MNIFDKILVTGSTGLVGGAIANLLEKRGFLEVWTPSRKDGLDLSKEESINKIVEYNPDYIFHAAALVGGISRNMKSPAEFGIENSKINNNVIEAAHRCEAKLLFLGSSCIYPRDCPQPMKEEYLLSGPCEPTNEMYALSKIFGIKLCQAYRKQYGDNFISCQPSNIYGEGDHFDLENSHVVGALFNRFFNAKQEELSSVTLWGTGSAKREFTYVTDVADACLFLMDNYNDPEPINIGTGIDFTIRELSEKIKEVVGFKGLVKWDDTKPDGMPRKIVDVTRINSIGWRHKIDIDEGLKRTYKYFRGLND